MLILTGPSASGKTELAHELIHEFGFHRLVTCTTRAPRAGERDGVDYHYFTLEEFARHEAKHEFVETTSYAGERYGSLKTGLAAYTLAVLEPQGVNAYARLFPGDVFIIYLEASRAIREERMRLRGDREEDIARRLARDDEYFARGALLKIDRVLKNEALSIPDLAWEAFALYQAFLKRKRAH